MYDLVNLVPFRHPETGPQPATDPEIVGEVTTGRPTFEGNPKENTLNDTYIIMQYKSTIVLQCLGSMA